MYAIRSYYEEECVDAAFVAGIEKAVGREVFGGLVRQFPVTDKNVRATHLQVADLPDR